jgi:GNAT superfamily N-acetyltransferase
MGGQENDLVFADCASLDDETFERFYREVLETAFSPAELISLAEFHSSYRVPLPGYHGMVVLDGDQPVGGLLGEYSAASGVMLLSYLAIREDTRGQGLGTRLLGRALPRWRETLRPVAILGEIEDPRCHATGPHGDPMARLRLYDRLGARLLPLSYFQPSLASGLPRVPGMLLISMDPEADGVPEEALTSFLDEYIESYEGAEIRHTDPEYLALRAQVTSWGGEVPLWPLSRLDEVPHGGWASQDG